MNALHVCFENHKRVYRDDQLDPQAAAGLAADILDADGEVILDPRHLAAWDSSAREACRLVLSVVLGTGRVKLYARGHVGNVCDLLVRLVPRMPRDVWVEFAARVLADAFPPREVDPLAGLIAEVAARRYRLDGAAALAFKSKFLKIATRSPRAVPAKTAAFLGMVRAARRWVPADYGERRDEVA
jgi:hypothetical protein